MTPRGATTLAVFNYIDAGWKDHERSRRRTIHAQVPDVVEDAAAGPDLLSRHIPTARRDDAASAITPIDRCVRRCGPLHCERGLTRRFGFERAADRRRTRRLGADRPQTGRARAGPDARVPGVTASDPFPRRPGASGGG